MAKERKKPAGTEVFDVGICQQPQPDHGRAQTKRGVTPLDAKAQMDREHLELQAQGIAFQAAVVAGASRAELFIRATQLLEAFQGHFNSEEGLMRSSNFPGLQPHIEEHRKLIEQMSGLRDDIGSGVVARCDALAVFVRLWAEQHIAGPDAGFAHFLDQEHARRTADSTPTVH